MKANIRKYYNIYKDGVLIAENIPNQQVCLITGMKNTGDVGKYAMTGKLLWKTYKIELNRSEELITKKSLRTVREPEFNTAFDEELINDWEKIRFKLNPNAKEWVRDREVIAEK